MSGCAQQDSHSEDIVVFLFCYIFCIIVSKSGARHVCVGTKFHPPFTEFGFNQYPVVSTFKTDRAPYLQW